MPNYRQARKYRQPRRPSYYRPTSQYKPITPPTKHNYILMAVVILIMIGVSLFLFNIYPVEEKLDPEELEIGSTTTPPPLPADGYQQPAADQNTVQGRNVNPIDPFPSFPNISTR